MEHTADSARRYAGDQLLLTVQTASRSTVEQEGRVAALTPGSAALYDPARPYLLDFPASMQRLVVVSVDRRDLPYSASDIDRLTARTISPDVPGLASLSGLLRGTGADSAEAASLADLVLPRLLTLAIDHVLASEPNRGAGTQRVAEIKDWARQHLADEDLSAPRIAREFFVSERTLYSLFATTGETPAAWLRGQRAVRARRLLRDTSLPVATIGAECGYPDPGTFTRFFRQATGQTPGDHRRRAATFRLGESNTSRQ